MFAPTVYLSRVNLNDPGDRAAARSGYFAAVGLPEQPDRQVRIGVCRDILHG